MIRWQIQFRSLRSNTPYTVNIYDPVYVGYPIQLIGGAAPFETQEDNSDDMFIPVRTQTGYIRIVDDGTSNWRDIIPTTDTDRPVTLTHMDGNEEVTDWVGFMQAQNFGARLHETPGEHEFPIQCPLSVMSTRDVSTSEINVRNFAYILWQCLAVIPPEGRPTSVVVQGGADAKEWLKTRVDWKIFTEVDKNQHAEAKYDCGAQFEDMCRYWGWTARMKGTTLYLTCADDPNETDALILAWGDLSDGSDGGTIAQMFTSLTVGDIFASADNYDYQHSGPSKVTVSVSTDKADDVIDPFDNALVLEMNRPAWEEGTIENDGTDYWHYTRGITLYEQHDLVAGSGNSAYFAILSKRLENNAGYSEVGNVMHFGNSYTGSPFFSMRTVYEHCFSEGFIRLLADTYRKGDKYEEGDFYAGNPAMIMRIGIGRNREQAKWWDGRAWQDNICTCLITIGNKKPELFTRYETGSGFDLHYEQNSIIPITNMVGRLYLEFLGTDDTRVELINGQRSFDLKDFRVEYAKNDSVTKTQYPNSNWWDIKDQLDTPTTEYKARNAGMIRNEYTVNLPYGSNEGVKTSNALLINHDGTYLSTIGFASVMAHPEQHLANRIIEYWATSKRRIECELLTNTGDAPTVADSINPRTLVNIDGTTMYPTSISHRWRDDEVSLVMMEVQPSNEED